MKEFMKAWNINEKDFPHNGTMAEKLTFCVRYAILAPSAYNTQPWHFKISDNIAAIYIDRRFALPVIDPDDREMIMACSAALFNLRLAIRYFGYTETTEIMPDPADNDLLARIRISEGEGEGKQDHDEDLFKSIPRRHTNRGAFSDKEIPDEILRLLKSSASSEGAWLHICNEHERRAVVNLVKEADHIQMGDKHFRRELASWTDMRRNRSGDGMPEIGLTYKDIMENFKPSIARRFEGDGQQAANDEELCEGSPVIAVLGTMSGGALQRIHAGQALMRILLEAESNGLAVSMLNQPCEVPELRLRLHDEIEHQGRAHMIMRIGYGGKPVYTPRRTLETILDIEGKPLITKAKKKAANDKNTGGFFGKMRGLFRK